MDDAGEGLLAGPDGQPRCFWHGGLEDYCRYHDEEWGYPVSDDDAMRLSPFVRAHIGIHGHYSFHLPDPSGVHRPLRDPDADDDE